MRGLTLLAFVLIAVCCYTASGKLSLRNEHQQQQQQKLLQQQQQHLATKKVDLPNRQLSPEQYRAEHQISHALNEENRQKRSQRDLSEYKDLNELIEELEDNSIVQAATVAGLPAEFDLENLPPLTYYLLLQKLKQLQSNEPTYRVRTPRLGRSIDFQLEDSDADEDMHKQQFLTQLMKKSVPFKPRLGKRAQVCA